MGFFRKKMSSDPAFDPTPGTTDTMPVVPYRVLYADLPFYSEPECRNQIPQARIVILEVLDPDDPYRETEAVPTLKRYQPGQLLNWSLNNKRIWEESWFRHPETQRVERAWTMHVEFNGDVISQKTVQENRTRLQEIEARLAARQKSKPV